MTKKIHFFQIKTLDRTKKCIPSRELTHASLGKGRSSTQPCRLGGDMPGWSSGFPLRCFSPEGSSLLKNGYFEDPKKHPCEIQVHSLSLPWSLGILRVPSPSDSIDIQPFPLALEAHVLLITQALSSDAPILLFKRNLMGSNE